MNKANIAFFDAKQYDIDFFNSANKNHEFNIKYFSNKLNSDTAFQTKGYNTICAFVNDSISKDVIDILVENNIKLIALRSAGYNNVDLKYIYKKIHVARVPSYSPYAVAEHAVALMLSLNRKIHKAFIRTRDNNFNITGLMGFDMNKKTAGIIGTGKIGKVLINILKGFGMKILAFDQFPDLKFAEESQIQYTDIDNLYKNSDIISLHCPLSKETFHIVNKDSIDKMKDGVMIINTGRGQLINTKDLVKGLKSEKIGSAGLDVYEEESEYFFEDFSNTIIDDDILARLLTFPNVIITSHQGFFTKEALTNIAETTLINIKIFYQHDKIPNEICYKCPETNCQKEIKGKCF